jgi:hypothetical protein
LAIVVFLLIFTAVYLGCGFIFALLFVFFGVEEVDETARDATLGFRIIIIPGTVLLWPILLQKWRKAIDKIVA